MPDDRCPADHGLPAWRLPTPPRDDMTMADDDWEGGRDAYDSSSVYICPLTNNEQCPTDREEQKKCPRC